MSKVYFWTFYFIKTRTQTTVVSVRRCLWAHCSSRKASTLPPTGLERNCPLLYRQGSSLQHCSYGFHGNGSARAAS
ncbi:hypothetical protein MHYP_G00275750 [Metynnis hypsauchen]